MGPSTRNSVRTCQRAGIVVIMVTGDHLKTAQRIAEDCGIYTDPSHIAMTGARFNALYENDQAKLTQMMPKVRVIARSQPFHKMNLVKFLKAQNKQVAVTGDGTNDAMAMSA